MSTLILLFLWNQDYVSEWIDMSIHRLLFLWNQNVSEWINMSTHRLLFLWNQDNVSRVDRHVYPQTAVSVESG
jgi:hypothetical protein